MMGALVVAPNAIQVGEIALRRIDKRKRARNLLGYMKQQGLVECQPLGGGQIRVVVTEQGRGRVHNAELKNLSVPTPARWDGIWRAVLFDIPETHRQLRTALTAKLTKLGFYKFQKSVWVYPYPCALEVEFVRRAYQIKKHAIVIAEIRQLSRETELRQHFRIHE